MPQANLPNKLTQIIAQVRRYRRRATHFNGSLVLGLGFCVVLVIGTLLHHLGVVAVNLAIFEILGLIALVSWVFYQYVWQVHQETKDEIKNARWLDQKYDSNSKYSSIQSALELARDEGKYQESLGLTQHSVEVIANASQSLDPKSLVASENWPKVKRLALSLMSALATISLLAVICPKDLHASMRALTSLSELQRLAPTVPSLRLDEFHITYRPPSYAKRKSYSRRISSGKIRALPGTEITIKTTSRQKVQSATLVLIHGTDADKTESRTAAKVTENSTGSIVSTSFIVSRAGAYRFEALGTDQQAYREKTDHRIELEVDLPPRVTLHKPTEESLEVNAKDIVDIDFSANDDFGLGETFVVWRILGTAQEGRQLLSAASSGKKRHADQGVFDLSKLELKPGDRIAYSVEAQDNDTVNGPKFGASRTQELRIYSEREHHREVVAMQQKALDSLIHILGDNLETEVNTSLQGNDLNGLFKFLQTMLGKATETNTLLIETVAAIKKDPLGRKEVATAFEKTRRELNRDQRRQDTALRKSEREAGTSSKRAPSSLRLNKRAQNTMVRNLEKNVVYLADLLNDQLMLDAEELTKSLREQQEALRNALEEYKNAPTEQKKQALMRAIQDIKKRMSEILAELSKVRGSIPQDFVNQDALKTEDTMDNLSQIENMIQEGNLDDAMNELEKMLNGTEKMLSEMRDGREELGEREYSEITKKAEKMYEDLKDIEKKQRELSQKTEEKAKKVLERMKERLGNPDEFVKKQIERIQKIEKNMKDAKPGAHVTEGDLFQQSERRVNDTKRALEAKDFGAAKEMAEQAMKFLGQLQRDTQDRAEALNRFGTERKRANEAKEAIEKIKKTQPEMQKIWDDINKLMPNQEQLFSKKEQKQMKEMAKSQQQLEQRAQQLKQQLSELSQELPMVGEGLPQMLDQAGQAMNRSSQQLGKSDATGSRGQQQQALDALGKFRDALDQMGQQGSGQGGGMPMPFGQQGMGQPGGKGSRGRDPRSNEKVAIPKPEQYKAPAEFREEILDAAKQGTVEQYKDAVREYYEEIVK
ncbi:MAG: DUF4175 family protein [Myxococcota bacterium]|nr:DUF4175 family protein [Myxococcota bacterium]